MKLLLIFAGILVVAFSGTTAAYVFMIRETRPDLFCFDPDDNLRPRSRCIMNPFRYHVAEEIAGEMMLKLKHGQTQVLIPFLDHLERESFDHILENEEKYRIKSWRVGEWTQTSEDLTLLYWVRRETIEIEEEVRFCFARNGSDWQLVSYSAIY